MTSVLHPRECKVTRKKQKSYGFSLRIEKDTAGHLIRNVEKNSPAEKAGLKDGDRVLRVNGMFVDKEEHTQVVEIVKNSGKSVVLLVLDEASYKKAEKEGVNLEDLGQKVSKGQQQQQKKQQQQATPPMANGAITPAPTTPALLLRENGYGFYLRLEQNTGGKNQVNTQAMSFAIQLIPVQGLQTSFSLSGFLSTHLKEILNRPVANKTTLGKLLQPSVNTYSFTFIFFSFLILDHVIKDVDSKSPAAKAGLKDNDILVAVNGERVDALDHESVVGKIKQSETKPTLLVVDKETDAMYKLVRKFSILNFPLSLFFQAQISPYSYYNRGKDPTPAKTEEKVELHSEQKVNHKPRICKMVKGPNGFGFSLNMAKNKPGLFINEVQSHGPADTAGVENNDFLVEVNGENVMNESYDKVVARIQSSGDKLTVLVCSKDAYKYFQDQNIPITASMADPIHDTSEPAAYAETIPAESERTSPEPRERVSNTTSMYYVYLS
uniref:PDZ domain containing 1 n=1 Tax=Anas platyrhynchos TaxID=8839 RepID=A0A8B9TJI9_ANAPL